MDLAMVAGESKARELAAEYERYIGICPKHVSYLHLTYLIFHDYKEVIMVVVPRGRRSR